MENHSIKYIRRSSLVASLAAIEDDKTKINLLIDKVMSLQDTLFELQQTYVEERLNNRELHRICVHNPF